MGFFDKLFAKKQPEGITAQAAPKTICAPITGSVMPLEEIPDPVFSTGVMGPGCGLEPSGETVYAPFDGTVTQTTETRHAVGITSNDGMEVLIHVGMDTVEMKGEGFTCLVQQDQKVKAGQALMTFSLEKIKAAGHPATTAVLLTNADDFGPLQVLTTGPIEAGAPMMKV